MFQSCTNGLGAAARSLSMMSAHDDLNPVASTTASAAMMRPSFKTMDRPSSPKPTARAGAMRLILSSLTRLKKPSGDGTPSSFRRRHQNALCVLRRGESLGTLRALNCGVGQTHELELMLEVWNIPSSRSSRPRRSA